MPTELPKRSGDPSPPNPSPDGPKIAAIIFVALLVVGCLWLFNALSAANDKLNCVASGRTNCDEMSR
jgi:hypothetical protein